MKAPGKKFEKSERVLDLAKCICGLVLSGKKLLSQNHKKSWETTGISKRKTCGQE